MTSAGTSTDPFSAIQSDRPDEIRRQVVEFVERQVSCEAAGFFRVAANDDDEFVFTGGHFMGHDSELIHEWITPMMERRALETPWLSEKPDTGCVNRFVRVENYYDKDRIRELEIYSDWSYPAEIGDQMRVLVFDGHRLLGWLGCLRRGIGERFRVEEHRKLQGHIESVVGAIRTADSLEAQRLTAGHHGLFQPDGSLEFASEQFATWLTPERRQIIADCVSSFDGCTEAVIRKIYAGAEIEIVRLDGPQGVRYLATLGRTNPLHLKPTSILTPRQREVADYAIAGATSNEIGEALKISKHTVKTHLKHIYSRLDVTNRVELADALRG